MSLCLCLTPNEIKHAFYRKDTDFLACMEMMQSRWAVSGALHHQLWNSASLLLRPDAIAGRRLFILNLLMSMGPSLYIVFHDETVRSTAPATVHLRHFKGPAVVSKRRRFHLRRLAGPTVASLLSYIHVSDDPADLVREMAILFGSDARRTILEEIEQQVDRTSEALRLIAGLERQAPRHALDPAGRAEPEPASGGPLSGDEGAAGERLLAARWRRIVHLARHCTNYHSGDGEDYDSADATIPDAKRDALPLDADLIVPEFGGRY
jgi:hypothetical protein